MSLSIPTVPDHTGLRYILAPDAEHMRAFDPIVPHIPIPPKVLMFDDEDDEFEDDDFAWNDDEEEFDEFDEFDEDEDEDLLDDEDEDEDDEEL